MKVVVDTSVWSLALRRNPKRSQQMSAASTTAPPVVLLQELIKDGRASLFGSIRQEILSGIKTRKQYEQLASHLRAFPSISLNVEDYELAAAYFNKCRQQGIQGSNTDFLICAVASKREYPILTVDKDFEHFSRYIPINLLAPG